MSELPILFDAVNVTVGRVSLLDDVSLALRPGPPTLLLGPNGSGKTTLLRLAMELLRPTGGKIRWGGRESGGARRSMVFQRPIMLRRSAGANIAYALSVAGMPRHQHPGRVVELMRRVGLADLAQRPARRLSGGEQQRLALARALACEPEVLFLDEPTASLDPPATKAVEDLVREVAASGVKVVMATHDLMQARRLAGEIIFLLNGRVIETGDSETFFTAPASVEANRFLRGELPIGGDDAA